MIHIIVTSYKEPNATLRAVQILLKQKVKDKFRVVVVDPFEETEKFLNKNLGKGKIDFILDPGIGKSDALNMVFELYRSERKEDLLVFTDGDVYVSDKAIEEMRKAFEDEKVGCVCGRPVPTNLRNTKYGYWAHLPFDGVDNTRRRLSRERKFFQCSGYLFAVRSKLIDEIPLDLSEDAVVPYLVWKKGFEIRYAGDAKVFVKGPENWKDWSNQKVRNIKSHENISKILPDMPRTKSLYNEIKEGFFFALMHPKNLKEFYWLILQAFARLYTYFRAFYEIRQKKVYNPAWRDTEINSTKPLD